MKFFFLALILCSLNVFAEDTEEFKKGFEAGKAAAATTPKATPKSGDSESSETNRSDKKFEIAASWGPDYTIVTQQLILSTYIHPNDVVGLKFGSGAERRFSSHRLAQVNVSLFYKRFFGNSFYISPEVVYLKLDETDDDDFFSNQDNDFYRGFGAGFRIGNQWHFKNVTIGCDWIGLGKLLVASENTDNRQVYATLLNIYLGWAF